MTNFTRAGDKADASHFLEAWAEVSRKDVFERRMFLEEYGGVWNKPLNKNLSAHDVFAHRLFMRAFSTVEPYLSGRANGGTLFLTPASTRLGVRAARSMPERQVTIASPDQLSVEVMRILASEFGLMNTEIRNENASALPFPDASFGVVVIDMTERAFPEYPTVVKEASRVLAPGGILVSVGINRSHGIFSAFKVLSGSRFEYRPPEPFGSDDFASAIDKASLTSVVLRSFDLGYGSYVFETTSRVLLALGRTADFVVRILDRIFLGALTNSMGIGLLAVAQKPIDDNELRRISIAEIKAQVAQALPTDAELKRVEIIVLKYKDPEVEWRAAKNIIENTEWPYKLVFFDNRPGTKNMSKAWNKLIRESTCDYVIIMDSDVFVPKLSPCWLTRLMNNFIHENCYVSLPKVTVTSCAEQRAQRPEDSPAHEIRAKFAGMCVLYKKEIFEKIGYFDEEFLLRGSDTEWAVRLLKSPYKAYISPDVLVDHVGSYSTKKSDRNSEYSRAVERQYANTLSVQKGVL